MHPVAQRRRTLRAVRIVGENRERALRAGAADDPVVGADVERVHVGVIFDCVGSRESGVGSRADRSRPARAGPRAAELGDDVLGLELHRVAERVVEVQHVVREDLRVERRVGREHRLAALEVLQVAKGRRRHHLQRPHRPHFVGDVGGQRLVPRDHHGRGPAPGRDAERLELHRQQRRRALGLGDVGVDAADERLDDQLAARMVVRQLGIQVALEHVQPRAAIARQLTPAGNLRHRSRGLAPPQLELEQPIPGRRVALGEEQVGLVLRVDVVDAPLVASDLHGRGQPGDRDRLRRLLGGGRRRRTGQQDENSQRGAAEQCHGHSLWRSGCHRSRPVERTIAKGAPMKAGKSHCYTR